MKITIPPAALEAGKRCICLNGCGPDVQCGYCLKTARAAFVAMVEAWEGNNSVGAGSWSFDFSHPVLILPLTENPDAEA